MSQDLGLASPEDRDWRAEWTERLARIDQHLVELNEALLLLLALDDLTRDVLADRPVTGEPESSPPSSSDQLAEWQKLLEENRTALESTRQRLETVADRLVSLTADITAVSSNLRSLVQRTGGTSLSSGQKNPIVPVPYGRATAADKAGPVARSAASSASGPASPGQGLAHAHPVAAKAPGLAGRSPQESRAAARRRRWFW